MNRQALTQGTYAMIQINLLPWREEARQRKKHQFLAAVIASGCISLFIIILFHVYLSRIYSEQYEINEALQSAINQEQLALNNMSSQETEMNSIVTQLRVIVDLYNESFHTVRLLNELTSLVPNTISLSKIKSDSNDVTLTGSAISEEDVSLFMQEIAKSQYFTQPVLSSINLEKNNKGNQRTFQLKVEQKG